MWLGAWMVLPVALAAPVEEAPEEIVVYGDLFKRWDHTRWAAFTELAVPYEMTLAAQDNLSFPTTEYQVKAVFLCEKTWRMSNKRFEVDCTIEDVGIVANYAENIIQDVEIERANLVLAEIDTRLTGTRLQLQVTQDGRVVNIQLEGVTTNSRRDRRNEENFRQLLSRMIVGFDLKLRKFNDLREGKWVEYNSNVFSMPAPLSLDALSDAGSGGAEPQAGSNIVVHYLNDYEGQTLTQSIGKGLVNLADRNYQLELNSVALFDREAGFMTERVWALTGESTASSYLFGSMRFLHAGRFWLLGETDVVDVGETKLVNGRSQSDPRLTPWVTIEGDELAVPSGRRGATR